jgi:hydroxymethylpyrimidine pyrophosphatase-like HAD family hydrolase
MIRLALLDIDGTIIGRKNNQEYLYSGTIEVLRQLMSKLALTFITGRGHPRFKEAETKFPVLSTVGDDIPIALENGARILDRRTRSNVSYYPLPKKGLPGLCNLISELGEGAVDYVSFHEEDPKSKTCLWVPNLERAALLRRQWSNNADVVTSSIEGLHEAMDRANPCMTSLRMIEPNDRAINLGAILLPGIHYCRNGNSFMFTSVGVDKGKAVTRISQICDVPLSEVMVIGNDDNDLPMFHLPGIGAGLLFGNDLDERTRAELPDCVHRIGSPDDFNNFITDTL